MHVELTASARRQLAKLPPKIYDVVIAALVGPITENPYQVSKPLLFELEGLRAVRRGDYRIFLSIDDAVDTAYVVRIEHRSTAYRPR